MKINRLSNNHHYKGFAMNMALVANMALNLQHSLTHYKGKEYPCQTICCSETPNIIYMYVIK